MSNIILSIIVTVYNVEKYIGGTLDSLLESNIDFPYEIIVIDDGSTDKSVNIVEKYKKIYKNIILISIKNQGVSNARNVGIENANGEYISFIDGDDTIEPGFYNRAIYCLNTGKYDLVQGNIRLISEKKINDFQQNTKVVRELIETKDKLEYFLGDEKYITNSVCTKIYRARIAKQLKFDRNIDIAEDAKFNMDYLLAARKILLLPFDFYNYWQRQDSAMHNINRKGMNDNIVFLSYCEGIVSDESIKRILVKRKIFYLLEWYNLALLNNDDVSVLYKKLKRIYEKELVNIISSDDYPRLKLLIDNKPKYDKSVKIHGIINRIKNMLSKKLRGRITY